MPLPGQRSPYRLSKVSRRRLLGGAVGAMLGLAAGRPTLSESGANCWVGPETGENFQVIDLADPLEDVGTSTDGRVVVLGTHSTRLGDLAPRTTTPLPTDRSHMIRSGIVSTDCARVAVHSVVNDDHALETLLLDTGEPTSLQPLSTGPAVLWTSQA